MSKWRDHMYDRWRKQTQARLNQRSLYLERRRKHQQDQAQGQLMMWVECSITPTPGSGRIATFTIYDMWDRR